MSKTNKDMFERNQTDVFSLDADVGMLKKIRYNFIFKKLQLICSLYICMVNIKWKYNFVVAKLLTDFPTRLHSSLKSILTFSPTGNVDWLRLAVLRVAGGCLKSLNQIELFPSWIILKWLCLHLESYMITTKVVLRTWFRIDSKNLGTRWVFTPNVSELYFIYSRSILGYSFSAPLRNDSGWGQPIKIKDIECV